MAPHCPKCGADLEVESHFGSCQGGVDIDEAIDTIYDAKAGKFRDLGGELVTADNLPRAGDLIFRAMANHISLAKRDWSIHDTRHGETFILHRAERPEPDLIYFPWPSGIDGIIGVIGPRGDISAGVKHSEFLDTGARLEDTTWEGKRCPQAWGSGFCFPTDAELTWVRDESEVPEELLREAKERGA